MDTMIQGLQATGGVDYFGSLPFTLTNDETQVQNAALIDAGGSAERDRYLRGLQPDFSHKSLWKGQPVQYFGGQLYRLFSCDLWWDRLHGVVP